MLLVSAVSPVTQDRNYRGASREALNGSYCLKNASEVIHPVEKQINYPIDKRRQLQTTFESYLKQGHLVLAATLSTYITSDKFAQSDKMRHFWDAHFIYRVERCLLPYRSHLDHDYVLEQSPEGYWHYHGLLAIKQECANRLWKHDSLNPRLAKDLRTFERCGDYRPFRVNSFQMEPVDNVKAWSEYITKARQVHLNTKY